ncbi:hypothetical protein BJ170DRAFT_460964 [Xylariales sp. AK1849]|nr:hypothetical protein BJ170DRAFT_460964 [Xylariales sp. AK1849]
MTGEQRANKASQQGRENKLSIIHSRSASLSTLAVLPSHPLSHPIPSHPIPFSCRVIQDILDILVILPRRRVHLLALTFGTHPTSPSQHNQSFSLPSPLPTLPTPHLTSTSATRPSISNRPQLVVLPIYPGRRTSGFGFLQISFWEEGARRVTKGPARLIAGCCAKPSLGLSVLDSSLCAEVNPRWPPIKRPTSPLSTNVTCEA